MKRTRLALSEDKDVAFCLWCKAQICNNFHVLVVTFWPCRTSSEYKDEEAGMQREGTTWWLYVDGFRELGDGLHECV